MVAAQPQFLLFCDAHASGSSPSRPNGSRRGRWHFMLERLDGPERLEVTDSEHSQPPDRLALLAVVRGLEALEQPSQVTLITTSRYVSRGLRYGLGEWREAEYSWEHFGVQKPIRNADLWQRIDCAMQFHRVACRLLESSLSSANQAEAEIESTRSETSSVPAEVAATSVPDNVEFKTGRISETTLAARVNARRLGWWDLAEGWRQWWSGRVLRPTALAGA